MSNTPVLRVWIYSEITARLSAKALSLQYGDDTSVDDIVCAVAKNQSVTSADVALWKVCDPFDLHLIRADAILAQKGPSA